MEGMTYQDWTRRRGERTTSRPRSSSRKKGAKVELAPREKRRLLQLLVCTLLFAVVLVGKGVFPQRLNEARETLGAILHADTDFTAAFLSLGQSLEAGEPMGETLETLWSGVFAPEEGAENAAADSALQTTDEQQSPESAASEEAEPQSEAESTAPQTQQQEDLQEEPVTSAEEPVSSQTPQEGTENP